MWSVRQRHLRNAIGAPGRRGGGEPGAPDPAPSPALASPPKPPTPRPRADAVALGGGGRGGRGKARRGEKGRGAAPGLATLGATRAISARLAGGAVRDCGIPAGWLPVTQLCRAASADLV